MSWQHVADAHPVARKPHTCILCNREIATGERYVRRVGFDDDGAESFAMHETCEALTGDWDEMAWLYNEPAEIREYELGEGRK